MRGGVRGLLVLHLPRYDRWLTLFIVLSCIACFYRFGNSNSNSKTVISIMPPTIHVKTDGA